ncbi:hypothetical protein P2O67_25625, partial [Escherichia coli]
MGSCAAPSAKGDDKFITTDYLQQCRLDLKLKNRDTGFDLVLRAGVCDTNLYVATPFASRIIQHHVWSQPCDLIVFFQLCLIEKLSQVVACRHGFYALTCFVSN